MDKVTVVEQFVRDSTEAIAAFSPAGEHIFSNGAMRRSGAEPALRQLMADPTGVRICQLGLRRTKPVPFGFGKAPCLFRATIRRMLADQNDPMVIVQLSRNARMAALTAERQQKTQTNDDRFKRMQLLARYEAFFNNANDGIGVLDGQGNLINANPALCALLDCKEAGAIGKPFETLFEPTSFSGPVFHRSGRLVSLTAQAQAPFDARLPNEKSATWLEINLTERQMLRRKEFFVVVRDLTTARRLAKLDELNEQLLSAQRLRDEFIYLISHEMRAPLSAVVSASENLRDYATSTPQLRHRVQMVEDAATDALIQFSAILDMTRGDVARPGILQPAQLVARLLRQHAPVAQRVQVDLQGAIAGVSATDVPLDPARVFLILTNLISNALKHCSAGGAVRFSVRTDTARQSFAIEVSDTGSGISKHRQSLIFDAFETSADRMDVSTGLGIGLALVRTAVREMGGEIGFVSAEGEGTTFQVSLPFDTSSIDVSEAAKSDAGPPCDMPVNMMYGDLVLIADDDSVTRMLVSARLRERGLNVVEADTGEQALTFFDHSAAKTPDLILMDRNMPVLNGVETTRLIRANATIRQPVIVGMTAFLDAMTTQELHDVGMNRLVQKPLTDRALDQLLSIDGSPLPPDDAMAVLPAINPEPPVQAAIAELSALIDAQCFGDAAQAAARLAADYAAAGGQADSTFLRSIALRLNDSLPLDEQQRDRLAIIHTAAANVFPFKA